MDVFADDVTCRKYHVGGEEKRSRLKEVGYFLGDESRDVSMTQICWEWASDACSHSKTTVQMLLVLGETLLTLI